MLPKLTRSVCALVVGSFALAPVCWAGENDKEPIEQGTPPAKELQCKVVFVKHIDCESAAKHVRALFERKDAPPKATWFRQAGAVLLRSTPAEVEQMEFLLRQIDVARPEVKEAKPPEREMRIYPLQHAKAGDLAELLGHVIGTNSYRTRRSGSLKLGLHIAIDKRTNVIVLLGVDKQLARAEELIKTLDVPVAPQMSTETKHRKPQSRAKKNTGGKADAA